jgi:hypothetical protein
MIQMEGNGGGDYLDLKVVSKQKGCIQVKSGHCCVNTIDKILPVEVLTAILSEWLTTSNGDVEQGIRNVWKGNKSAAEKLIQKYRKANKL